MSSLQVPENTGDTGTHTSNVFLREDDPLCEAISELTILGYTFEDVLIQTGCDQYFLQQLYDALGIRTTQEEEDFEEYENEDEYEFERNGYSVTPQIAPTPTEVEPGAVPLARETSSKPNEWDQHRNDDVYENGYNPVVYDHSPAHKKHKSEGLSKDSFHDTKWINGLVINISEDDFSSSDEEEEDEINKLGKGTKQTTTDQLSDHVALLKRQIAALEAAKLEKSKAKFNQMDSSTNSEYDKLPLSSVVSLQNEALSLLKQEESEIAQNLEANGDHQDKIEIGHDEDDDAVSDDESTFEQREALTGTNYADEEDLETTGILLSTDSNIDDFLNARPRPTKFKHYKSIISQFRFMRLHPRFHLLKSLTYSNKVAEDLQSEEEERNDVLNIHQHTTTQYMTENEIVMDLVKSFPTYLSFNTPLHIYESLDKRKLQQQLTKTILSHPEADFEQLYGIIREETAKIIENCTPFTTN